MTFAGIVYFAPAPLDYSDAQNSPPFKVDRNNYGYSGFGGSSSSSNDALGEQHVGIDYRDVQDNGNTVRDSQTIYIDGNGGSYDHKLSGQTDGGLYDKIQDLAVVLYLL